MNSETLTYSEEGSTTSARTTGEEGFLVGPDSSLIKLHLRLKQLRKAPVVLVDDVLLTDIALIDRTLLGFVHIVNLEPDDPSRFYFQCHGFRAGATFGADFTARPLCEIGSRSFRAFVEDSYLLVRATGRVLVSEVSTRQAWFSSSYRRLMVPLSNNGRDVTQALVAIRRHTAQVH